MNQSRYFSRYMSCLYLYSAVFNDTSPQISCGFTSLDSYVQFLGNSIPLVGFEAQGNFTNRDDIDAFFAKVTETDAILEQMGQRCQETDGSFLKYMGTVRFVYFARPDAGSFFGALSDGCCERYGLSLRIN